MTIFYPIYSKWCRSIHFCIIRSRELECSWIYFRKSKFPGFSHILLVYFACNDFLFCPKKLPFILQWLTLTMIYHISPNKCPGAYSKEGTYSRRALITYSFKWTREWSSCSREVYNITESVGNRVKIRRRDNAHKGTLQARTGIQK